MDLLDCEDLSLRHLPEMSDTSFSFQMPAESAHDLLADDEDFFQGVDDILTTPLPQRTLERPLTLSQLTPRPDTTKKAHQYPLSSGQPSTLHTAQLKKLSSDKLAEAPVEGILSRGKTSSRTMGGSPRVSKPIQRVKPVPNATLPSTPQRFETLKTEVETLVGQPEPLAIIPSNPKPQARRAALREERAKSKITTQRKNIVDSGASRPTQDQNTTSPVPRQQPITSHVEVISKELMSEISDVKASPSTDSAGRLLMYGYDLMNTNEHAIATHSRQPLPESRPDPHPGRNDADADMEIDRPLTLSQISPHKEIQPPVIPIPIVEAIPNPPSSQRASKKRPPSAAVSDHPRKRARITTDISKSPIRPTRELRSSARKTTALGSSGSGSRSSSRAAARTAPTAKRLSPVKKPPSRRPRPDAPRAAISKASTSSLASSSSKSLQQPNKNSIETVQSDTHAFGVGSHSRKSAPRTRTVSKVEKLHTVTLTKPVGFNFQSGARSEARNVGKEDPSSSTSQQKSTSRNHSSSVPGSRPMNAAQEAAMASRREKIVPIVPVPFELSTEVRAKEREKFDRRMKEKEEEQARALEQRRLQEEEAEEREIKELRKKAIPRAHEVPEWYNEAPKRQHKDVGTIQR